MTLLMMLCLLLWMKLDTSNEKKLDYIEQISFRPTLYMIHKDQNTGEIIVHIVFTHYTILENVICHLFWWDPKVTISSSVPYYECI